MAADLHIHVMTEDMTEDDIATFFSNTLGSKYFDPFGVSPKQTADYYSSESFKRISDSPNVWVGEVSWLKQAVLSDTPGEFVPDIVAGVSDVIGEDLPVCDDTLINKIEEVYSSAEEHSFYSTQIENRVIDFLKEHRGKRLFTVSW